MASKYMTQIRGIKNPLTGLLNIGEEETKGTESYIEGHKLMKKCIPSFIGNIESRYLFDGRAQIIVCDGFLGNNIVKIAEGWINHVNNDVSTKLIKNIESIEEKIDMVDVFRAEKFVLDISKVAIKIGAKILWTQEGVIDEKAASLGRSSGLKVVMDKCPKKVLKA